MHLPTWKQIGVVVLIFLAALLLYLLFWPVPIEPYAWQPGDDPGMTGPYVANDDLASARVFPAPTDEAGPEDTAVGPDGFLYSGWPDGQIRRIDPTSGRAMAWADSRGHPLGLAFDADGDLWVADAHRGLLEITDTGSFRRVDVRVDEIAGKAATYMDSVRIAPSGLVWFTAPSQRFPLEKIRLDGMETQPTGRLLSLDPSTGRVLVELDDLMFANGVAIDPDEAFVLVNEWSRYRITRLWLKGQRAGRREVFYDNLPGYPDNLSFDPETGIFWVGVVIPRSALLDRLHPHPFLMKILPRIPESLQPQMPPLGWVVGIDRNGRLVHNLQDSTGKLSQVTGARRLGPHLYLTSIMVPALSRLDLPPVAGLVRTEPGDAKR